MRPDIPLTRFAFVPQGSPTSPAGGNVLGWMEIPIPVCDNIPRLNDRRQLRLGQVIPLWFRLCLFLAADYDKSAL